jgi:hypothetical protein
MRSAAQIVARLLENDDLLPDTVGKSSMPLDPASLKTYINKDYPPTPVEGVPIVGYYRGILTKLEGNFPGKLKRKVGNNTYLLKDNLGNISVRLHWTDIITVSPDDTVTVDVGSWQTVTTAARLGDWLPGGWKIYSLKGTWYWWNWKNRESEDQPYSRLQPFSNGDYITADGILHPHAHPTFKKRRIKRGGIQ